MKKILQICLLIVFACSGAFSQEVKVQQIQETQPSARLSSITLEPGTAKNLPMLFTVATKTLLFLNIAEEIGLSSDQKVALTEIHKSLQSRVQDVNSINN